MPPGSCSLVSQDMPVAHIQSQLDRILEHQQEWDPKCMGWDGVFNMSYCHHHDSRATDEPDIVKAICTVWKPSVLCGSHLYCVCV